MEFHGSKPSDFSHQRMKQSSYPLRPLCLRSHLGLVISSSVGVAVPQSLFSAHESAWETFADRIREMGYNALILGALCQEKVDWEAGCPPTWLKSISHSLASRNVKLFLVPAFTLIACPAALGFAAKVKQCLDDLFKCVPDLGGILWESLILNSDYTNDVRAENATKAEILCMELSAVERGVQGKADLIFYVPGSHPKELHTLCLESRPKTIIAFSAVGGGNPTHDHQSPNPFWTCLRKLPYRLETPLLPLVNTGAVNQGGGFWPSLPYDIFEMIYSRCSKHRFEGMITLAESVPSRGGFLDCALWTGTQIMLTQCPAEDLIEDWFAVNRPDYDYSRAAIFFRAVRGITVQCSRIGLLEKANLLKISEEIRAVIEGVMAQLRFAEVNVQGVTRMRSKTSQYAPMEEYFLYFSRDIRRILMDTIQKLEMNVSLQVSLDEGEDAFWTRVSPGFSSGLRTGSKIHILDKPNPGLAGSRMEQIYKENCLLHALE